MNITVIGRRWFERQNGNTYHSVEVYKDGELLDRIPFAYGYDRQYEQSAVDILKKHGFAGFRYLRELKEAGYTVISTVSDVSRKKDL